MTSEGRIYISSFTEPGLQCQKWPDRITFTQFCSQLKDKGSLHVTPERTQMTSLLFHIHWCCWHVRQSAQGRWSVEMPMSEISESDLYSESGLWKLNELHEPAWEMIFSYSDDCVHAGLLSLPPPTNIWSPFHHPLLSHPAVTLCCLSDSVWEHL